MTKWSIIDIDKDRSGSEIMGATFAMKVPGGIIIRNVMDGGGTSMVFVPLENPMTVDVWIEENKVT